MDKMNLELFDTPNWGMIFTILSVLLALLGVLIAVYFSRRKLFDLVTVENQDSIRGDIKAFLVRNCKIQQLSERKIFKIEILVSNLGNYCFKYEDFQTDITIELEDKNSTIIDCQAFSDCRYTNINLGDFRNNIMSFKFNDFDKNNNLLLKVRYLATQPSSGKIIGKVREMKELNENILSSYPNNDDGYLNMKYKNDIIYGVVFFLALIYFSYFLFKLSFGKDFNFIIEYIHTYSWKVCLKSEFIFLAIYFLFTVLFSINIMKFLHKFFYPFKWKIRNSKWMLIERKSYSI